MGKIITFVFSSAYVAHKPQTEGDLFILPFHATLDNLITGFEFW